MNILVLEVEVVLSRIDVFFLLLHLRVAMGMILMYQDN